MHFVILYGSVRRARKGVRVVRWIEHALRERDHQVTTIDPLEHELPLLDRMYKEFDAGQAPPTMETIAEALRRADGFVVVSGEYNHGVPPALKNLLDHFQREFFWRPAALMTYSAGHTGGARVQAPLRSTLGELGMVTLPSIPDVPEIGDALADDGKDLAGHLDRGRDRFLDEFEWYARALGRERADGVPYGDPNG